MGRTRSITRLVMYVVAASTHWFLAGGLLAQDAGGGTPNPSAPGEATNVVVTQPFPYGGLFLLVVMVGLSLFAVCRSSRRN